MKRQDVNGGLPVGGSGATPLHYASLFGHADVVKLLLRCGATTATGALDGTTAPWRCRK